MSLQTKTQAHIPIPAQVLIVSPTLLTVVTKEKRKRKEKKNNGNDLKGEKLILAHSSEGSAHHTGEDSTSPIDGRSKLRLSHMSVDQGAEPSSHPQVPPPQPYVCQTSTIFKQSYQRGTRCSNYNMVYKYL